VRVGECATEKTMIDKAGLLLQLRQRVERDLEDLVRRQRDIQLGATHEENRAEHAKDTRATEQSYLARGLAERVEQQREVAGLLATLDPTPCDARGAISLGTVVVGRDGEDDAIQAWWLIPGVGGVALSQGKRTIRTLTPASPLGRALIGLRVGDEAAYATPRGERILEILEIQ
jgi:transcription elongation GreA/GreB family factor